MLFQLSLIRETISLEWFAHYKSYTENKICKWRKLFCFLSFSVLMDDLFLRHVNLSIRLVIGLKNKRITSFHFFLFFLQPKVMV